jgi:sugar O-acyltransferase (sialic acid O-acetyltransferase NeuD family)
MSRPVIVLGAGGHARVVLDLLAARGVDVVGFVAADDQPDQVLGHARLGTDDVLLDYDVERVRLANGLGSTGSADGRQRLFDRWKDRGFRFEVLVHPAATVSAGASLGAGTQVMAGAVVQVGTRTGENVIVNTHASIDHDCTIESHVHVAPGATLSGDVRIGAGAHVGAGAVILQGVSVGSRAIVGAGAVVIEDVPDHATVVGVPAKSI